MEQKALDRGFEPLMPDVWLVKHPVTSVRIILVRDEKFLSAAEALAGIDPDCVYFTVKELIGLLGDDVFDIKKRFNGFGNIKIIEQRKIID